MLEAGERRVIAELEGPGCVRRIFCTSPAPNRNFILRVYWDGEDTPSVEAPVDDFFGIHHDVSYYPINNQYISVKDRRGLVCYFPMPFGRSARVEIEAKSREAFIYIVDWQRYLTDKLHEDMRFHASWRRENPAQAWGEDFFVMDAVGRGYLLGYSLGVRLRTDDQRWSHAGSENLYIDGETTGEDGTVPHYLRDAGGEDSFDVGFGGALHTPDSHLYAGMPYYEHRDTGHALARHVLSAYRFYVNDLVPFEKSLHFRWGSQANDMCMTAYWYQTEPHRPFIWKLLGPTFVQLSNPSLFPPELRRYTTTGLSDGPTSRFWTSGLNEARAAKGLTAGLMARSGGSTSESMEKTKLCRLPRHVDTESPGT